MGEERGGRESRYAPAEVKKNNKKKHRQLPAIKRLHHTHLFVLRPMTSLNVARADSL
jgi:hypothetical protein